MQRTIDQLTASAPHLIGALVILIVGYLVARIVAAVVSGALRRTSLDARLGRLLASPRVPGPASGDGGTRPVAAAPAIGRVVFWLLMLFVLVAFFQALELPIITQPLNALLVLVLAYIPLLIGAAILALIAWVVATVVRRLLLAALPALRLDERLGAQGEGGAPGGRPLTRAIAEAVYYLIFLLFLPAILGALGLYGLLGPVQRLVDGLLGFLPNLFAAVLLLVIGLFVARLVRRVVTDLLVAAGLDRFAARVGLAAALGRPGLSGLIGLVVYLLILLPVVIGVLQALQLAAITAPAAAMLYAFLAAVPRLVAAGLTLVIAYVIARVLASLVASLLTGLGVNTWLARLGFARPATTQPTLAVLGGRLVLVAIMLFAVIEALQALGFVLVAALAVELARLAGHILLGLALFALGLYLARLAAGAIRGSGTANAGLLAAVAQGAILVLAGAMALREMGLAPEIITLAFGLTLGALAVAAAIAFGVGGRQVAGRELERFVDARRARGTLPVAAAGAAAPAAPEPPRLP